MEEVSRRTGCGAEIGREAGIEGVGDVGEDVVAEVVGVVAGEVCDEGGRDVASGLWAVQVDETCDGASEVGPREAEDGGAKRWAVGPGDLRKQIESLA